MTDLDRAIAAARDALDNHDYGHEIPAYVVRDLLAALDAAQGEAVAKVFVPGPLSQEFGMDIFPLPAGRGLPHGTKLYLAPQAPPAAVPAGYALVQLADLAALEATDFGRCGWSVRADLAARRLRDGLLAAANKGNGNG